MSLSEYMRKAVNSISDLLFGLRPLNPEPVTNTNTENLLDTIRWGIVLVPPEEVVQHFLVVGATGAGKTTIIRLLIQDIVPTITPDSDHRLVLYDAKQDALPILAGMNPDLRVTITNPFDERGAAWDMAKDIREPRVALEIAETLVPKIQESQPYFSDASRHFLQGVMLSYLSRGLNWSFGDLLRPLRSSRLLRRVLTAAPEAKHIYRQYFFEKKMVGNVLSTAATKAMAYESIAAAWDHAEQKFSLEDWATNPGILVLGNSETSRVTIDAINRCLFKRLKDVTLELPDSESRRTYFVLDELSDAGRFDGLVSLCKKGRSKGVSVVLGFQSICGLREKSLYGPEMTAEIVGQIGYKIIGRLECEQTAEWASKLIGEHEIREITQNWKPGEETSGYSENFKVVPTVLPSELMSIPPCNLKNGLTAFYLCRNEPGVFEATLPGNDLFEKDLISKNESVEAFMKRPISQQYLREWTPEEEAIFAPEPGKKSPKPEDPDADDDPFSGLDEL